MSENNALFTVRLTPALMLDCRLTWKKLACFVVYTNFFAVFLYAFGFGATLSYSLTFCNCAGWFAFLFLVPSNYVPKPTTTRVMVGRIAFIFACSSIAGAVVFALIMGIPPISLLDRHLDILIRMILLSLFCGSSMAFFFKSGERLSEAKRLIMEEKFRNLDMKNTSMEMELKLLQAQIEPHFLFNTISNVVSLIGTDPDKAKTMMEHFSSFLRGSIHIARNTAVPVSQEIELLRNYLDIQKVRMGGRLNYVINVADALLDRHIPPLLIQPLVENSIKHGLEPQIDGGEIMIRGEIAGDVVRITVADSGRGIDVNAVGNGIGLENVRKRIQMACNEKSRLLLEENVPSGVRAIIEIHP